jgi:hypothetical protein
MPGFMQFLTGIYLWVGLVWFHSLREKPLFMAALAFTAYGVHWFAIGMARAMGGDPAPERISGGSIVSPRRTRLASSRTSSSGSSSATFATALGAFPPRARAAGGRATGGRSGGCG